jgi:hypothetical protein
MHDLQVLGDEVIEDDVAGQCVVLEIDRPRVTKAKGPVI